MMRLLGTHATGDTNEILDHTGRPVIAGKITPRNHGEWHHDPEHQTHRDLARYADWRKTKCRPRDVTDPNQVVDELNQAIHEFVGEVAELGELFIENGLAVLAPWDPASDKFVNEVGDIFFTGSWVLDTLGNFGLRDSGLDPASHFGPPEMVEVCRDIAGLFKDERLPSGDTERDVLEAVASCVLQTNVLAGKLCNSFKKMLYQGRPQDPQDMAINVLCALATVGELLAMGGNTVSYALWKNIEKLDARYPRGYEASGPGGGIRTGKGA